MNKRLALLEQMTNSGQADAFAWYGLALEYRREGQSAKALQTFETLRDKFPDYLPMYLICGQALLDEGRPQDARPWLEAGVALAQKQDNSQALAELEDALDNC